MSPAQPSRRPSGAFAAEGLEVLEARFAAREPEVLAFVPEAGRFERLRREMAALEARFPESDARPPLFGVPVGVKDIFHVDGFETRAGSRVPPDELAGPEATAVTRLRNAGALILGKTATTEFAYFGPGPTRNPHDPGHTPGGSSSGSAAAVGAGLCPLALGTQTIGSIGRPAAFCGAVGWKPSYERILRDGVIPLAPSLDHVGTFTNDVVEAAIAASVLVGDWRPAVHADPGPRPRLGIPVGPYLAAAAAEGRDHLASCQRRLAEAGYSLVEVPAFEDFEAVRTRHDRLLAGDVARVHAPWFPRYGDRYHPKTRDLVLRGADVSDDELEALRAACMAMRHHLERCMATAGVDVWIAPGARGTAPAGLDSTGDPIMSLPWSQSGLPAVTVPAGRGASGLPLGLQIVGRFGDDERLLAWGAELAEVVG